MPVLIAPGNRRSTTERCHLSQMSGHTSLSSHRPATLYVGTAVFLAVCAFDFPNVASAAISAHSTNSGQEHTQETRRLDVWATHTPDNFAEWLKTELNDRHGVSAVAYGEGLWVGFASDVLSAPQDATSNAFKTRFSFDSFANTQAWIGETLARTTHSVTSVAAGGGKWVAWADPRTVNAGEFHAVRRTASSFQSWAVDNANAGCFSTTFAFGQDEDNQDIFYGVCNPKLVSKNDTPDSPEIKPPFEVKVFGSTSLAKTWMQTSLDNGYAVKALTYGQGQLVAYSEKRSVAMSGAAVLSESVPFAIFETFKSAVKTYDWIDATQRQGYDLTALTYSTDEDTWLAYMELPDPSHTSVHNTCSYGCPLAFVGDGQCDRACNNNRCNEDGGDCEGGSNPGNGNPDELPADPMCRPGCAQSAIGDGFCDEACWVEGCEFDGGDCECAKGCRHVTMVGDSHCDVVCDVQACGFDGGDCLAGGFAESSELGDRDPGTNPDAPLFYVNTSILDSMLPPQDAARTRESIHNATAIWGRSVLSRHKPILFSKAMDASVLSACSFASGFDAGYKIDASIYVELAVSKIDGASGVRARAGPCAFDRTTELPRIGTLQLDMDDVLDMLNRGVFVNIIVHELGHIIGIGSEWGRHRLIEGRGTVDPEYRGDGGRAGLLRLGGSGRPKLADLGGKGRYELHWRESTFGDEIMTGQISAGKQPLSILTLMSLHDLGYLVNLTVAEPLTLLKPEEVRWTDPKRPLGSFGSDVIDGATVVINVIDVNGVVYVREPGKKDVLPGHTYYTFPPESIAAVCIAGVILVGIGGLFLYSYTHEDAPTPMMMVSQFSHRALPLPKPKKKLPTHSEKQMLSERSALSAPALPRAETLGSNRAVRT